MGWLEGLVSGYSTRSHDIEKRKMEEAVAANEREARLYQLLLNSGDEEAAAMAATGMLQSAQPRRKRTGLQGWMCEVESNPIYPKLLNYLSTQKLLGYQDVPVPGLPAKRLSPAAMETPGTAAQPLSQTTTPGAPPPAPEVPMPSTPSSR